MDGLAGREAGRRWTCSCSLPSCKNHSASVAALLKWLLLQPPLVHFSAAQFKRRCSSKGSQSPRQRDSLAAVTCAPRCRQLEAAYDVGSLRWPQSSSCGGAGCGQPCSTRCCSFRTICLTVRIVSSASNRGGDGGVGDLGSSPLLLVAVLWTIALSKKEHRKSDFSGKKQTKKNHYSGESNDNEEMPVFWELSPQC